MLPRSGRLSGDCADRGAFQYLINSWTTLVELMSIYKRLRSFEHELDGDKIQEVTHTLS
ncbi:TPA: hypothetical protein PPG37_002092 [Escherichia coli]|nr:hypothetical protein [Escherichia coli]